MGLEATTIRQRLRATFLLLLTACLATACIDSHIQAQEPSREEPGMSVRILRSAVVRDAPLSGKVVGSIQRGGTVTALCFLRAAGQPVVQVTGVADGFVRLNPKRRTFDADVVQLRSTLAGCERDSGR
jgi:hypothetical protein